MTRIDTKTLARSALLGLFLTVDGLGLQSLKSRFILHIGPPPLAQLAGCAACYLAAGFLFALAFFLLSDRLPGRTWIGKGLRYAVLIYVAVWISGFFNLGAIDFDGGWRLLSPAKVEALWMAAADGLNFMIAGFLLGLVAGRAGPPVSVRLPWSSNLALRAASGALLLPVLCAGLSYLVSFLLPYGLDLSGARARLFYVFLFVPLSIAGAGTARLHDVLRSAPPSRGCGAESLRVCLAIFLLYWVANAAFVLFLGFTWQVLVDFLLSLAVSLFLTIVVLESAARVRWTAVTA
ncbi:MAG TPA: hypothetical protein VFI08_07655 [Spirochaetia bacterium]|nr:hypothetical protein [Spirochaetia bacterium]